MYTILAEKELWSPLLPIPCSASSLHHHGVEWSEEEIIIQDWKLTVTGIDLSVYGFIILFSVPVRGPQSEVNQNYLKMSHRQKYQNKTNIISGGHGKKILTLG